MKISQLIKLLQQYMDKFGDLPVYFTQEWSSPLTVIRHWKLQLHKYGDTVEHIELTDYMFEGHDSDSTEVLDDRSIISTKDI